MFDNADKDWPFDINKTVFWTKRTCTICKHKLWDPTNCAFTCVYMSVCMIHCECVSVRTFDCIYLHISISISKWFIPLPDKSHYKTYMYTPVSNSQRQWVAMQICHERGVSPHWLILRGNESPCKSAIHTAI